MLIQLASIHNDIAARIERRDKTIQAPWRWTIQILAIDVVVRAVAGTLEAVAVVAEGDFAAEMDAYLVERQPVRAIFINDPILRVKRIG